MIRELAEILSIVIRGRGSQFILKDHPRAFHVLTVALLPTRVGRVAASLKVDRRQARREISRFDRSRRAFIRHYFHADLEDPIHHDLVINTEHMASRPHPNSSSMPLPCTSGVRRPSRSSYIKGRHICCPATGWPSWAVADPCRRTGQV
ncbi:MAG: cytidylate kinase-like family protein [Chloroflexota bacterium]|nr:cytidylate kinase-like family protein [Chloroflexota bacterium]